MNERLQEIAEKAWRATSDEVAHLNRMHNRAISHDEQMDVFEQKFAELIVRECAKIGELKEQGYGDYDPDISVGWYMRKYFGIE